jgi:hypothetical protein
LPKQALDLTATKIEVGVLLLMRFECFSGHSCGPGSGSSHVVSDTGIESLATVLGGIQQTGVSKLSERGFDMEWRNTLALSLNFHV